MEPRPGISHASADDMRFILLTSILALVGTAPMNRSVSAPEAVFSVRITRAGTTMKGSAVLIQRTDGGQGVTLYFITSAHFFRDNDGVWLPAAQTIAVEGRSAVTVAVNPQDVEVPRGTLSDLALMRVVVPASSLTPRPTTFATPNAGALFLVAGLNEDGQPVLIPQHVAHRSTMRVLGDREITDIAGCAGAPAVTETGIFGIVAHCEAGRRPEIALFEVARRWLSERVPGLAQVQGT
jgi:hypothetical protein